MINLRLEGVAKTFPAGSGQGGIESGGLLRRWGARLRGHATPAAAERVQAVAGVDLSVPAGQTLSVLGPSGCGKTTLLRLVAGLEHPDSGKIFFNDFDVTALPAAERGVGMVFQNYALYPHMEAKGNLAFYFRVRHRDREVDERVRVTSQLLGVGFAELLDKKPPVLSKGQQQRVAIGRCIVRDPTIFLFDEPMSNVDARVREQTRVVIKRLLRHFDVTSIYVTHDQTEAVALGDRLAIMREGRIEQLGTYEEVYARPTNLFVAGFLGVPPMSFFAGRLEADGLRLKTGDLIPLPGHIANVAAQDEDVTLGIRAKDVRLYEPVGGEGLVGVVEVVEAPPSERHQLVHLKVAGFDSQAHAPRDMTLRPGYVVRVEIDPAGLYLFAPDGSRLWPR